LFCAKLSVVLMGRDQNPGTCNHCGKTFSYYLVHNGFSDTAYGYCNQCSYSVSLSAWSAYPHNLNLRFQGPISSEIEPYLKECPCGGIFRAPGGPRCPHCLKEISAVAATSYIEANALGTKKGCRWDRRWDGVYSMVIEDHVVNDWWRSDSALDVRGSSR